jgi:hypothetical protein
MSGKKMEGNEEQRRKKAREAKRHGHLPSEEGATMGASKQRRHLPRDDDHAEKLQSIHRGKVPPVSPPEPRPGSRD